MSAGFNQGWGGGGEVGNAWSAGAGTEEADGKAAGLAELGKTLANIVQAGLEQDQTQTPLVEPPDETFDRIRELDQTQPPESHQD